MAADADDGADEADEADEAVAAAAMADTFSDGAGGAKLSACVEFLLGVEHTMDLAVVLLLGVLPATVALLLLFAEPSEEAEWVAETEEEEAAACDGIRSDLLARMAVGLMGCVVRFE